MEKNFNNNNENCIEWITGDQYATATFTSRKHINRIKKLYEQRKNEFKYFHQNTDGSICAKIPLKWVKQNPGAKPGTSRPRTPEQIEASKKALAAWRENNKKVNSK